MRKLLVFLTLLTMSTLAVAQSRRISIDHFKDEPVEIVSMTLGGVTLQPGDHINSDPTWPSRLEITVKNVTDKPISKVQILMFTPVESEQTTPFAVYYYFIRQQGAFLQPNATVVLTPATGPYTGAVSNDPATVTIQKVEWNSDKSYYWSAGQIMRRGADDKYYPDPPSQARYRMPDEYRDRKSVV